MRVGNKKIFHLEAWVVKVMSLYKVSVAWAQLRRTGPPLPRIWPGTDLSLYRDGSVGFPSQHFFLGFDMEVGFDDF